MTNFIEEQQREAREDCVVWGGADIDDLVHQIERDGECTPFMYQDDVGVLVKQTITNTLNHILESGLLEEKKPVWFEGADVDDARVGGHNTLAKAIKAHLDELIKSTK